MPSAPACAPSRKASVHVLKACRPDTPCGEVKPPKAVGGARPPFPAAPSKKCHPAAPPPEAAWQCVGWAPSLRKNSSAPASPPPKTVMARFMRAIHACPGDLSSEAPKERRRKAGVFLYQTRRHCERSEAIQKPLCLHSPMRAVARDARSTTGVIAGFIPATQSTQYAIR